MNMIMNMEIGNEEGGFGKKREIVQLSDWQL